MTTPMPYARNAWYVAALAKELQTDRTLLRRLLDEDIALYRGADGQPVALSGTCPHRFAPLANARVIADNVVCPYHGLRFNSQGGCVHNPQGAVPARALLKSFPVMERYGAIWFWPGDPVLAQDTSLPEFDFLESPPALIDNGYLHTRANYLLSADNLIDLSHLEHLHPETLGGNAMAHGDVMYEKTGNTLWCRRANIEETLPPFLVEVFGFEADTPIDRWLDVRWDPPALLMINVAVAPSGFGPMCALHAPSAHWITPETAQSSHYFFAVGGPATGQPADDERMQKRLRTSIDALMIPFEQQDLPVLEAQQRHLGTRDLRDAEPVFLASDAPAMRARQIVSAMIEAERNAST